MYAISNADFALMRRLLGVLQQLEGCDRESAEIRRKAKRLRKKFNQKKPKE